MQALYLRAGKSKLQTHVLRRFVRVCPSSLVSPSCNSCTSTRSISSAATGMASTAETASEDTVLSHQDLWPRVQQVYAAARASGATAHIDSRAELVPDAGLGVTVVVQVAAILQNKPKPAPSSSDRQPPASDRTPNNPPSTSHHSNGQHAATSHATPSSNSTSSTTGTSSSTNNGSASGSGRSNSSGSNTQPAASPSAPVKNPFLPYEQALWVGHLSPTHTLLLNKFNVVPYHVLVVTRQFESQTDPLNGKDLSAAWTVLQAMPTGGLAFYNCGANSGRSQPHKHVQIVPLPFTPGQPPQPPMQALVEASATEAGAVPLNVFAVRGPVPYRCFAALLPDSPTSEQLAATFDKLLTATQEGLPPPVSYNAILTRDFMMLGPRRSEYSGPVAVNSLGFAGSILVKSEDELAYVQDRGPSRVLLDVGFAWED